MASFGVPDSLKMLGALDDLDAFDDNNRVFDDNNRVFDDNNRVFDDNNSMNEATEESSQHCSRQHLVYQNECKIGETWYRFKKINGVQLNNDLELMFSLEWELDNFIFGNHLVNKFNNLLISAKQLQHHYKTKDWIHRFNNWSRHEAVVVGKVYTWEDLHIDFKLDKDVQDWLKEKGLDRFVHIFNEQECFTMINLTMLTHTVMKQWGLNDIVIRYILKCTNDLKR